MITDIDRNSRTLIVCFVIAIFALIPLRFVEYGNIESLAQPQVLGEQVIQQEPIIEEVVEARLEAPYNEIEKIGEVNDLLPSETEMQPVYSQNWLQE
jgi:hypothetical protein